MFEATAEQGANEQNHLICKFPEFWKSASLLSSAQNIDCHLFLPIPTAIEYRKSSMKKKKKPMNDMLWEHRAYHSFVSKLFQIFPLNNCRKKKKTCQTTNAIGFSPSYFSLQADEYSSFDT